MHGNKNMVKKYGEKIWRKWPTRLWYTQISQGSWPPLQGWVGDCCHDRSIQTIKLFSINKKTPRSGLSFDMQPIFLSLLGYDLLAITSVKRLLGQPLHSTYRQLKQYFISSLIEIWKLLYYAHPGKYGGQCWCSVFRETIRLQDLSF